jgi:RNA-directed DNA polymerase
MSVFIEKNLTEAFVWLCDKRIEHCANNDIWDMRRHWDRIQDTILQQLNDGTYTFSPLQRFEFTDEIVSMWSAADMIALKMITQALEDQMQLNLSKSCYHTKGNGGLKKALIYTYNALESHHYFFRSDIKSYYESIRYDTLIRIIETYVKDPILRQLIMKALNRIETYGGNFYEYPFKGIPKRSPLSPLLSAIALLPLDQAMEANPHIFYARFVDDWVVLTKSKTMLRKVIKQTHGILNDLHLEMHPTKTYIGRIEKGFNFLTYFMKKGTILPSRVEYTTHITVSRASKNRTCGRVGSQRVTRFYERALFQQPPSELRMTVSLSRSSPAIVIRLKLLPSYFPWCIASWHFWQTMSVLRCLARICFFHSASSRPFCLMSASFLM